MKISMPIVLAALFLLAAVPAALAQGMSAKLAVRPATGAAVPAQICAMRGNSTVNISFNDVERDVLKIKSAVDEKVKAVEALAKEAGVTGIEMQSLNYSASSNASGGCGGAAASGSFQTSANISFIVKPADNAAAFASLLVKKGYNASFNVNMFRQCGYGAVPEGD